MACIGMHNLEFFAIFNLCLITWLMFNKYEAKNKKVDEGRVEGEVNLPILAKMGVECHVGTLTSWDAHGRPFLSE
jgi:hypothetical protein